MIFPYWQLISHYARIIVLIVRLMDINELLRQVYIY